MKIKINFNFLVGCQVDPFHKDVTLVIFHLFAVKINVHVCITYHIFLDSVNKKNVETWLEFEQMNSMLSGFMDRLNYNKIWKAFATFFWLLLHDAIQSILNDVLAL